MNLYSWRSNYLSQVGSGHLIAAAETPNDARELLIARFNAYDRENYEWDYGPGADEDALDDIRERWRLFEADLRHEPTVIPGRAMMIRGSS